MAARVVAFFLVISPARAQLPDVGAHTPIVLSQPANLCLDQAEWSGDIRRVTLKYFLVVAPEHQGKSGDVFVGFRLKSQPDKRWLYSPGLGWRAYDSNDPNQGPWPYRSAAGLFPLETIALGPQGDLSGFAGDGEILVGYGLRANPGSFGAADTYKEMLDSQRFEVVWSVGADYLAAALYTVCLKFTELSRRPPVVVFPASTTKSVR